VSASYLCHDNRPEAAKSRKQVTNANRFRVAAKNLLGVHSPKYEVPRTQYEKLYLGDVFDDILSAGLNIQQRFPSKASKACTAEAEAR